MRVAKWKAFTKKKILLVDERLIVHQMSSRLKDIINHQIDVFEYVTQKTIAISCYRSGFLSCK